MDFRYYNRNSFNGNCNICSGISFWIIQKKRDFFYFLVLKSISHYRFLFCTQPNRSSAGGVGVPPASIVEGSMPEDGCKNLSMFFKWYSLWESGIVYKKQVNPLVLSPLTWGRGHLDRWIPCAARKIRPHKNHRHGRGRRDLVSRT